MTRIGIIICTRYGACGGGKCFRALRERKGAFARYAPEEAVEVAGYASCGGCPGGNVELVLPELVKNGCQAVHLATGFVVGYPPCPHLPQLKALVETKWGLPVVVGTHPIPWKYMETHGRLGTWEAPGLRGLCRPLLEEPEAVMRAYD